MRSTVLYFFLLLGIFFNLISDNIYKYSKFYRTFSEKNFNIAQNKKNGFIIFDQDLVLLLANVDCILEK